MEKKTALKPQEYYYLYSPLFSDPSLLIKYTIQGLLAGGHISAYYRSIYINKRAKYKRKRLFLSVGPAHHPDFIYSHAEQLIMSLFDGEKELRLHAVINGLRYELDKDPGNFKTDFVYKDLVEAGYCSSSLFLTSSGKKEKEICKDLIDTIDKDIDLLLHEPRKLGALLNGLGTNIIFLDKVVLQMINKKMTDIPDLNFLTISTDSAGYSSFVDLNAFDSIGDISFDSDLDFDGFGGGDGGGAGSGDLW